MIRGKQSRVLLLLLADYGTMTLDDWLMLGSAHRHGMLRGHVQEFASSNKHPQFLKDSEAYGPCFEKLLEAPPFLRLFEENSLISHPHGNVFPASPVLALD